jgi:small subunit ribosomal protein S6
VWYNIALNAKGSVGVSGGGLLTKYEVIFIIRPDASEEAVAEATEKAQGQVTRNGGIVQALENWGRKKLAYEIGRLTEGIYVKMDIEAPGEVIQTLARHFTLSEVVIRHQTIRQVEKKKASG